VTAGSAAAACRGAALLAVVACGCGGSWPRGPDAGEAATDTGAADASGRDAYARDAPGCTPSCAGSECGPDGCGGTCGTCDPGITCQLGRCSATERPLPMLHNHSGASSARVRELVLEAIDGLGFAAAGGQGPRADDRFFVSRYYMAWIDQTGFYGKINGLWRLDEAADDSLDFVVREAGGRPVSFLAPGENGDGRWAPGYLGAEHLEFPSRVPEPDDDPGCASRDWCNQYSLNEAAHFTDPDIRHWSACNTGSPPWADRFDPIVEETLATGLRLVYEGPLVKEADGGDRARDGDHCHEDWLFEDGVRRRVFLRVGLELRADAPWLDRLVQVRNPAGNPPFDGAMSFIGGFVITAWPSAHPLKRLDRFLRPESRGARDELHGLDLIGGRWNAHPFDPRTSDEIFAWLDQPISLSATDGYVAGQTATLSHVGPSDNADVGICMCFVHGGLELGGGLIHGGVSLPVAGGGLSIEARRRLALPGGLPPPGGGTFTYESETDLLHVVGRAEADGWGASTALDAAGHMAFGPYATGWGGGTATATFRLMVDDASADDAVVATIDVHDATTDETLAARDLRRRSFGGPMAYTDFTLAASLAGRAGHRMETRVWFHDRSYLRLDRVVVVAGP